MGAPVVEPEKDQRGAALDRLAPRFDRLPIELEPIGAAGQRPQFAEGQEAGGRIGEQLADPGGVAPAFARAVERVAGKAVDLFHRAARLVGSRSRRNCRRGLPPGAARQAIALRIARTLSWFILTSRYCLPISVRTSAGRSSCSASS